MSGNKVVIRDRDRDVASEIKNDSINNYKSFFAVFK